MFSCIVYTIGVIKIRVMFRIKGWISDDEFRELLKFSDYQGRIDGEASFVINIDKMRKNDVSVEEVIDILSSYGDRITGDAIIRLKRELGDQLDSDAKIVKLYKYGERIIARPNFFFGELYKELKGILWYDKKHKLFYTFPGLLPQLEKKLSVKGIIVKEESPIFQEIALETDIKFKGELRDYQREALDRWVDNNRRGIIALPTGSGKTIIAISAIANLQVTTLIVVFTKEQLHQWISKIKEMTTIPGGLISPFYGEEKRLAPITVTTYQTAYRYYNVFSDRYTFLIVDEVHHLPAEKFRKIAMHMFSKYRMGLSATVIREDGRHVDLFPLMGGVVYYRTPQELVDKGYLAPFVTRIIRVDLKPEEKKEYEELRRRYKMLSQGMTFEELLKKARRGDIKAVNALRLHNKLKQLMHKTRSKIEAAKELVEQELKNNAKILVFTQYVDQAEELGRILNAPVITGNLDTKTRKRVLEEFRKQQSGVLVMTTVGDEGLDIPDVNVGIVVAGTGSRRQFIQRLGRLLRPKPGKTAKLYEIISRDTGEEYQARKRKKITLDDIPKD